MLVEQPKLKVSVCLTSCNGYNTHLPLALQAVISQTYPVHEILLYDDNGSPAQRQPLLDEHPFRPLMQLASLKGINVLSFFSDHLGLTKHRNHFLDRATGDLLWMVQDRHLADPRALEEMVSVIRSGSDLVGTTIPFTPNTMDTGYRTSTTLEDNLLFKIHRQWVPIESSKLLNPTYLIGSYLVNRKAVSFSYPTLPGAGVRADEIFTMMLHSAGASLSVIPSVLIQHMCERAPFDQFSEPVMSAHPGEKILRRTMRPAEHRLKLLTVEGGIGDHFMLRSVLPEVVDKYADWRVVVAASIPEVFVGCGVEVIPFNQARYILGTMDLESRNPYTWALENKYHGPFIDVFRFQYVHGYLGNIVIRTGE